MAAPVVADCESVANIFHRLTGQMAAETYSLKFGEDPWLTFPEQVPFPVGQGNTINTMVGQRTRPTSDQAWAAVGTSNGEDYNSCVGPRVQVPWAYDLVQASLFQKTLESGWFCYTDLMTAWNAREQIRLYSTQFQDNVRDQISRYFRDSFQTYAQHKVVATTGLPEDDSDFPSVYPTSNLTNGILQTLRQRIKRDGAHGDGTSDVRGPIYTLISDDETIDSLIKDNEAIRQDFRWSSRVNELLGPLGSVREYGGFYYKATPFPRRYNRDGSGGFVEVPYYSQEAATSGTKAEVNPAWEAAEFTVSYIWANRDVIKFMNPPGRMDFGSGVVFDVQKYRGEFTFFNEKDYTCNPHGNMGKWMAQLMFAPQPIQSRWGYAIIHLRCNPALDLLACASGSGYGY